MAYRIQDGEPVEDAVQRIAAEQVEKAVRSLQQRDGDLHEAVHDVRKRCKKIRGLLRLVRDPLGEDRYKSENRYFRDTARLLGPLRDSHVHLETVGLLLDDYRDSLEPEAFSDLQALIKNRRHVIRENLKEQGRIEEAESRLAESRERIDNWRLTDTAFDGLGEGLGRVYRRGRKGLSKASESATAESFHEWRKRVKYLWYHLRLLRNVWPALLQPLAKEVHHLSDLLGDGHDLAEFSEFIEAEECGPVPSRSKEALQGVSHVRRIDLETRAIEMGSRIYIESERKFVKRFAGYWEVFRREPKSLRRYTPRFNPA